MQDGVDAERIGFRRLYLSERWNLKEAGVILGAIAARTERIEVASGIITTPACHPLHMAGMAATFQATFGPRFVLGLGRGNSGWLAGAGMQMPSYGDLADYVDILRRLWRGETVTYAGALGGFAQLQLEDVRGIQAPPVVFGTLGQPLAAKASALSFDGVLLPPVFTPDATASIVQRLRTECEQIGRDPASLQISQSVITAPELDDEERALAHARRHLPGCARLRRGARAAQRLGPSRAAAPARPRTVRGHGHGCQRPQLPPPRAARAGVSRARRVDGGVVRPRPVDACVKTLTRFAEAGVDEIVTYGSTPNQNAALADAWWRAVEDQPSTSTTPASPSTLIR